MLPSADDIQFSDFLFFLQLSQHFSFPVLTLAECSCVQSSKVAPATLLISAWAPFAFARTSNLICPLRFSMDPLVNLLAGFQLSMDGRVNLLILSYRAQCLLSVFDGCHC